MIEEPTPVTAAEANDYSIRALMRDNTQELMSIRVAWRLHALATELCEEEEPCQTSVSSS